MSKVIKVLLVVVLVLDFTIPADAWIVRHRRYRSTRQQYVTAKSAFLWDVSKDKIYFAKNADVRIYPASTTKVMTVMLALEKLPMDEYVTVSQRATQVPPTSLGFRPGEQYRVKDLIYACLLKSANDAAGVLAEAMAGSEEKFVDMMNQKAWAIGARHTHFANPHGLPSAAQQYSTARDMAIIFNEALKNPFFQKAITLRYRIIYSKNGQRHFLKSHNRALFSNWKQEVIGKTGYTREAGACFVGYFRRGNDILIADIFDCHNLRRWGELKWIIQHYAGVNL